jgi:hypothetical protein
MIMQQQAATITEMNNVPNETMPSMTSIPIPNMQGGMPMMGGVIMVDMQQRQRNPRNTTELEIVEEGQLEEHRIDIRDDDSESSHLSFDM